MKLTSWKKSCAGGRNGLYGVYQRSMSESSGCAIRVLKTNGSWEYEIKLLEYLKNSYDKKNKRFIWSGMFGLNFFKGKEKDYCWKPIGISRHANIKTKELAMFMADLKAIDMGYIINDPFVSSRKQ